MAIKSGWEPTFKIKDPPSGTEPTPNKFRQLAEYPLYHFNQSSVHSYNYNRKTKRPINSDRWQIILFTTSIKALYIDTTTKTSSVNENCNCIFIPRLLSMLLLQRWHHEEHIR